MMRVDIPQQDILSNSWAKAALLIHWPSIGLESAQDINLLEPPRPLQLPQFAKAKSGLEIYLQFRFIIVKLPKRSSELYFTQWTLGRVIAELSQRMIFQYIYLHLKWQLDWLARLVMALASSKRHSWRVASFAINDNQ